MSSTGFSYSVIIKYVIHTIAPDAQKAYQCEPDHDTSNEAKQYDPYETEHHSHTKTSEK